MLDILTLLFKSLKLPSYIPFSCFDSFWTIFSNLSSIWIYLCYMFPSLLLNLIPLTFDFKNFTTLIPRFSHNYLFFIFYASFVFFELSQNVFYYILVWVLAVSKDFVYPHLLFLLFTVTCWKVIRTFTCVCRVRSFLSTEKWILGHRISLRSQKDD